MTVALWIIAGLLCVIAALLLFVWFYVSMILARLDEMHIAVWSGLHGPFNPKLDDVIRELQKLSK